MMHRIGRKVIYWPRTPRCENVKVRWINGIVTVVFSLLVPCRPHSWTTVSGKTRPGKALGRNCLV